MRRTLPNGWRGGTHGGSRDNPRINVWFTRRNGGNEGDTAQQFGAHDPLDELSEIRNPITRTLLPLFLQVNRAFNLDYSFQGNRRGAELRRGRRGLGLEVIAVSGATHPQGDDPMDVLLCDLSGLCASAVALRCFNRAM